VNGANRKNALGKIVISSVVRRATTSSTSRATNRNSPTIAAM
jgi:hypothetical protein